MLNLKTGKKPVWDERAHVKMKIEQRGQIEQWVAQIKRKGTMLIYNWGEGKRSKGWG